MMLVVKERWHAWRESVLRRKPYQWPRSMQLLAGTGGVALMLALAWLLVLQPQEQRVQEAEQRQRTLQEQYRQALTRAAGLPALRTQAAHMARVQAAHPALQPSSAAVPALLAEIQRAGLGHAVRLEQLKPQAERRQQDHMRQKLSLKAVGSYAAMAQYLAALPGLRQALEAERWTLTPVRSAAGRAAGQLQWQAQLFAYRFALPGEVAGRERKAGAGGRSR